MISKQDRIKKIKILIKEKIKKKYLRINIKFIIF